MSKINLHTTLTLMIFVAIVTLCGYQVAAAQGHAESERPNIIVMYSDDHTAQAVGAYRGALNYGLRLDHTPTPHIDRLAEKGMRFDNAFVTNSICKPSRAVLLSGEHSHRNGVITNLQSISIQIETFPLLLQKVGYQTAMIGKWHLGTEPQGFDHYEVLYGQGPYYNPTFRTADGDVEYHGHTSGIITDRALHWLRRDRDRDTPFMMIYNHKAPHREWLPGPALEDYRDRDLPEPSTLLYDYSGLTTAASEQDMEIGEEGGSNMVWGRDLKVPLNPETGEPDETWNQMVEHNRLTDEQLERIEQAYAEENEYLYENYASMTEEERLRWRYQRYIKDYLRVVREIDDEVGRVMAYLERENLADNTIVIYAGDQGFFLGEKGWFDKRWIYEESMRMPFIVHWPDGVEAGTINENLIQNLDVAPTLLDVAGAEIPARMQGNSLTGLLQGDQNGAWRDAIYYHYFEGPEVEGGWHDVARHYGIRTDRFTLAYFPDHDEWELFDLEADPDQISSIYGDPDYAEVQERLTERLYELQDHYGDDSWH